MPRSPRPLGAECTYHVTARGNNRQVIFHEDADRVAWIELPTSRRCSAAGASPRTASWQIMSTLC